MNTIINHKTIIEYIRLLVFTLLITYIEQSVSQTLRTDSIDFASTSPKLVINKAHNGFTTSAAFSQKGELAASISLDKTISIWHVATGRLIKKFHGQIADMRSVVFHPNEKHVLTASQDGSIRLWDIENGKELKKFLGHEFGVASIAISHDAKFIISGGWDGTVRIWDIADENKKSRILLAKHDGWVTSVTFSKDSKLAASGSLDNWRIWEVSTGKELHRLSTKELKNDIRSRFLSYTLNESPVAFHPIEQQILTGGKDGSLSIWDITTGKLIKSYTGYGNRILSLSIDPTGMFAATASQDGLLLWDLKNSNLPKKLVSDEKYLFTVTYSPTGDSLLTTGGDTTIRHWNSLKLNEIRRFGQHMTTFGQIGFSDNGDTLFTSTVNSASSDIANSKIVKTKDDSLFRLWDLKQSGTPSIHHLKNSKENLTSFSNNGQFFITKDSKLNIYDTKNNKLIKTINSIFSFSKSILSHDNSMLIGIINNTSGTNISESLIIKNIATDKIIFSKNFKNSILQFAISNDNKKIALVTGYSYDIAIFDVESGKEILQRPGILYKAIYGISLSPNGTQLLAILNDKLLILSMNASEKLIQLNHIPLSEAFAVSPDWKQLLTYSANNNIHLTNIENGSNLYTFKGHTSSITSFSFHPKKSIFASSSRDQAVKIWRLSDGREIATLVAKPNGDWFVTDPEGRFDAADLEDTQELHWVMPTDLKNPMPIESFMKDYYEPRLLSRILSGEILKPVRPISTIKLTQPKVEITNIELEAIESRIARVTVSVTATKRQFLNQGKQITEQIDAHDLRLFRDGQLVGYVDGLVARYGGKPFERTFTIRLAKSSLESPPIFSAYAFNDDRVKSATVKSTFKSSPFVGEASVQKGTAYLITMGVNNHENTDWNLKFAANDAKVLNERVTTSLQKTQKYDLVVNINLISNDNENNATKMAMQAVLNRLSGKMEDVSSKNLLSKIINANLLKPANPDDTIIISFSGHGYASSNGNFYMITQNTGFGKGKVLTTSLNKLSISSEDISNWIRDIDAGDISMIIDACQSEASIQKDGFKPGPMGNKGLGQLSFDKGMRILAASQNDQAALENNKIQHGLLSYSMVVDGLKNFEADYDANDGQITMDEWFRYGLVRVPKLTDEIRMGTFQGKGSEWRIKVFTEESVTASGATVVRNITNIVQQPALFDFGKSLRAKKILASKNTSQ